MLLGAFNRNRTVVVRHQKLARLPSSLSWQVQVRSHLQSRCKPIFSFQDNPYFLNTVIIKEYYLDA